MAESRTAAPHAPGAIAPLGDRSDATEVFGYVKAKEHRFPTDTMSRVLEVSRSEFYA